MGVRIDAKQRTRERIIRGTKSLLQSQGFVKVSSKEIAKVCEVSQGTIFLHFGTKEGLLNTILNGNIDSLEEALKSTCNPIFSQDIFLKKYLEIFADYEDIMARIYKDYSYLDSSLIKKIDTLEILSKNLLFDNYKQNNNKPLNIVDSFIAIDAFLSQIKEYLISKETFTSSNSIIRQKRGRIVKLYRLLFG